MAARHKDAPEARHEERSRDGVNVVEQQDDAGALCDLARPKAHSKRLNTAGTVTLNIDEVLCVHGWDEGQQSKASTLVIEWHAYLCDRDDARVDGHEPREEADG